MSPTGQVLFAVLAGVLTTRSTAQDMCWTEGSIAITVNSDTTLTSGSVEIVFPERLLDSDAEEALDQVEMTARLARTLDVPPGQLAVAFDFTGFALNNTVRGDFQLLAIDTLECPVPCFGLWSDWAENASPCGAIEALDGQGWGNSQRTFTILQPGNDLGADCPVQNNTVQNGTCCEGHWGAWSDCATTCGNGTQWRTFNVTVPSEFLGRECEFGHGTVQMAECQLQHPCEKSTLVEGYVAVSAPSGSGVSSAQTAALKRDCTCLWQDLCAAVSDSDDDYFWMCSSDPNLYMMGNNDGDSLLEMEAWLAAWIDESPDMKCAAPSDFNSMADYYDANLCLSYMSLLAAGGSAGGCQLPDSTPELPLGYSDSSWCFWLQFGFNIDNLALTTFTNTKVFLKFVVQEPDCQGTVNCPADCEGYWSDPYYRNWTLVDGSAGQCLVREYITVTEATYGGASCCQWDLGPESALCPTGYFTCANGCDWDEDCKVDRVCAVETGGKRRNPMDFLTEKGCSFPLANDCEEDVRGAGCTDCVWDVIECPIPCAGMWNETSECEATCESGLQHRSYWVYRNAQFGGAACEVPMWDGSTMMVWNDTHPSWDYIDSRTCSIYDVAPCPYTQTSNYQFSGFCFPGLLAADFNELEYSCDSLWNEYFTFTAEYGFDTTALVESFESDSSNSSLCWGEMSNLLTQVTPTGGLSIAIGPDFVTGANNATCNRSTTHPEFCIELLFGDDPRSAFGGSFAEYEECGDGQEFFEYIGYDTYPCSETCCPIDCVGSWGDVYVDGMCYAHDWVESTASFCNGAECDYDQGFSENVTCATPCVGNWTEWSDCSVTCENGTQYRTYSIVQPAMYYFANGTVSTVDPYGDLADALQCPFEDNEIQTTNCTITEGICDEHRFSCGEVTLSYAGATVQQTDTANFKIDCLCLWAAKCEALADDTSSSLDYIQCSQHLQFYRTSGQYSPAACATQGDLSLSDREEMPCFDYMSKMAQWVNSVDCGSGIANDPYCVWIRFADEPFTPSQLPICSAGAGFDAATAIIDGGARIYVGYSVATYYDDCTPLCCPVDCDGYWLDPVQDDCLTQQFLVTQPSVCGGAACNCTCDALYDDDPNFWYFRANPVACTADAEDDTAGVMCNLGECKQDCQGHWEDWSECTVDCDAGNRTRTYVIDRPALFGGADCSCNMTEDAMADMSDMSNVTCDGYVEFKTCRAHAANEVTVGFYEATFFSNFGLDSDFDSAYFAADCAAYEEALVESGCLTPLYDDEDRVYYDESCELPEYDVYDSSSSQAVLSGYDENGDPVPAGSLCFYYMRIAASSQPNAVDCPFPDAVGGNTYCLHIAIEDPLYFPLDESDACIWENGQCTRTCSGVNNNCHGGQIIANAEGLGSDVQFGSDGIYFNFYLYAGLYDKCCPSKCQGDFGPWIVPSNTTLEGHCNYTVFTITNNATCGGDPCMYEDGFIRLPSECSPWCEGYWGEYDTCNATCGTGMQTRTYYVTKNATNNSPEYQCPFEHMEQDTQPCNATFCPNCTVGQLILTYNGETDNEINLCAATSNWWEFTANPKIADLIGMSRAEARDLLDLVSCTMTRGTGAREYLLDVTYERCFECVTQCCPMDCAGEWTDWFEDNSTNCTGGCDIRVFNVTMPRMCGEYSAADFALGGDMGVYSGMAMYGSQCPYEHGEQYCMDEEGVNHPGSFVEIVDGAAVPGYCCNASINCPVPCEGSWTEWSSCSASCASGTSSRSFVIWQEADADGADCLFENNETQTQDCCANPIPDEYFCGSLEFQNSIAVESFDISQFQCGCELAFLDIFPEGSDDFRGTPTCDSLNPPLSSAEEDSMKSQCISKMALVAGRSFLRLSTTCYGQESPLWCVDFQFENNPNRFSNCSNEYCNGDEDCPYSTVSAQNFNLYFEVYEPGDCGCCPADCSGEWGAWADCDIDGCTCPRRTFEVATESSCGGVGCPYEDFKECQPCDGDWGPWSECSLSCGTGSQTRSYTIFEPALNGGPQCTNETAFETRDCCVEEPRQIEYYSGELVITYDGSSSTELTTESLQESCLCLWFWACQPGTAMSTAPALFPCLEESGIPQQLASWSLDSLPAGCDLPAITRSSGSAQPMFNNDCLEFMYRIASFIEPSPTCALTEKRTVQYPLNDAAYCIDIQFDEGQTAVATDENGNVDFIYVAYNVTDVDGGACTCCPTHCMGEWSTPFEADDGCTYLRYDVSVEAECGGDDCTWYDGEMDLVSCPVPCNGSWVGWSACDATCDGGTTVRTYTIFTDAANGGEECPYDSGESQTTSCNATSDECRWGIPGRLQFAYDQTFSTDYASTSDFMAGCEDLWTDFFNAYLEGGIEQVRVFTTKKLNAVGTATGNQCFEYMTKIVQWQGLGDGDCAFETADDVWVYVPRYWCVRIQFDSGSFTNALTGTEFYADATDEEFLDYYSQTWGDSNNGWDTAIQSSNVVMDYVVFVHCSCDDASATTGWTTDEAEICFPVDYQCCPVDCDGEWTEWDVEDVPEGRCLVRHWTVTQEAYCLGDNPWNENAVRGSNDFCAVPSQINETSCERACVGYWTNFSACDQTCGIDGYQYREFVVVQSALNGGTPCNYTNGTLETQNCIATQEPVCTRRSFSVGPRPGASCLGCDCLDFLLSFENQNDPAFINNFELLACPSAASCASGDECTVEYQFCDDAEPLFCPQDCVGVWSDWGPGDAILAEVPGWDFTCDRKCSESYEYRYFDVIQDASDGGRTCTCMDNSVMYPMWMNLTDIETSGDDLCVQQRNCTDTEWERFCVGECQYSWSAWTECFPADGAPQCGNGTRTRTYRALSGEPSVCANVTIQEEQCDVLCPAPRQRAGSFYFSYSAGQSLQCSDETSRFEIMEKIVVYLGFDSSSDSRFAPCVEGDTVNEAPPAEGGCPVIINTNGNLLTNWSAPFCQNIGDYAIYVEFVLVFPQVACDCPINCTSDWSEWSVCPGDCHDASEFSSRTWYVVNEAENGGADCQQPLDTVEYTDCQNSPCCSGTWSEWSECDATCNTGLQYKNFTPSIAQSNGESCFEPPLNKTCLYVDNEYYPASQTLYLAGSSANSLTTADLQASCATIQTYLANNWYITPTMRQSVCYQYMSQIASWSLQDSDCFGRDDPAQCVMIAYVCTLLLFLL